MAGKKVSREWQELDEFIRAFEADYQNGLSVQLQDYLPDPVHPLYRSILAELVRVDLEFRWSQGKGKRVEDYLSLFPRSQVDEETLRGLAFEEYRLRRQAGEKPSPAEYLERFGLEIGIWPRPDK